MCKSLCVSWCVCWSNGPIVPEIDMYWVKQCWEPGNAVLICLYVLVWWAQVITILNALVMSLFLPSCHQSFARTRWRTNKQGSSLVYSFHVPIFCKCCLRYSLFFAHFLAHQASSRLDRYTAPVKDNQRLCLSIVIRQINTCLIIIVKSSNNCQI